LEIQLNFMDYEKRTIQYTILSVFSGILAFSVSAVFGKILDFLAFSVIGLILFAVFFLKTGKNAFLLILLSIVSAVSFSVIAMKCFSFGKQFAFRRRKQQAEREVKALLYADTKSALETVFSLLEKRYPVSSSVFLNGYMTFLHDGTETCALMVIQKFRTGPDDILSAWRNVMKDSFFKALVIAIPGKSEQDVLIASAKMTNPEVVIITRAHLKKLFSKYAKAEAPETRTHRMHPIQALRVYITRRRALRYLLYSFLLIVYYSLSGKIGYLAFGLILFCISVMSFRKPKEPEKLI